MAGTNDTYPYIAFWVGDTYYLVQDDTYLCDKEVHDLFGLHYPRCLALFAYDLNIFMSSDGYPNETTEVGDISPSENAAEDSLKLETKTEETIIYSKEVKTLNPKVATIMAAGKVSNGKSTALNNIFGLNLAAGASASSVTSVVSITEVTKKILGGVSTPLEVTLQVIDTPGLGAVDIRKDKILKEMKKVTKGVSFTLVYCFSVAPNTILTETDQTIITNLHRAFGKEVWSKCVLLFASKVRLSHKQSRQRISGDTPKHH